MTRHLENLKLPSVQQRAALDAFDKELRTMKATVIHHPHMIPALLLMPAITKIVGAFDREQALLRCAVVALAAERYRLAHGHWPDKLESLTPDPLAKVPDDPFSSGRIQYRKVADGIVVYSFGVDEANNGGTIDREKPTRPGADIGFQLWDPEERGQPPVAAGAKAK